MKHSEEEFDHEGYRRTLGARIAKVRKSKAYSQDKLCLEAGFARGTLSKIESGQVDPKASTMSRIAATLGVPIGKLME